MGDSKLSSDHKVTLPIYSGSNPDSWLKKYNLACEINNLNEQDKLARVPFYLPDTIGDWVLERNFGSWKDFVESFESRYHPTTSKVELLSSLISIRQNSNESPREYLTRWESMVSNYFRKNDHGVPELVLVQSFVSGLSNATLKQLTIDKLNAASTVDKMVKVFSLIIVHHCGISCPPSTSVESSSVDPRFESMMQGMNQMFTKMDTFLSQTISTSAPAAPSSESSCVPGSIPETMDQWNSTQDFSLVS
ncbi:hypothetical protein [Absidia glauca]|uniref:Retrotransposon gag domain-containing protein n=1 Tax=Absidia glauca TaxID=4829 RepID=A0A168LHK4_ABSGL|nr:hypothetical protein [Absidia glauca]SAM09880.1 hypothetical protein [Absidia glauca]